MMALRPADRVSCFESMLSYASLLTRRHFMRMVAATLVLLRQPAAATVAASAKNCPGPYLAYIYISNIYIYYLAYR